MPDDDPLSLGVSATTGRPLPALPDEAVTAMLGASDPNAELKRMNQKVSRQDGVSFAISGEVDANLLEESGWGVIYGQDVSQKVKDALQPLIEHRKQSAHPFVIYEGGTAPQSGDTAEMWLRDRGVRLDVVDPDKGVPFYLLIVASPKSIPFELQYTLDLYWAVGRLWFDTPEEFRQYADSVIAYEKAALLPAERKVAMFATEHEFDDATQRFMRNVATPMINGEGVTPSPLGKRQKFGLETFLGDKASKATFCDLLLGRATGGTPSILFSGSHGMQFDDGDPRQAANQGALVCHDWEGYGDITENHWFGAGDVPKEAKVHGLIHFFFACHGGGCSALDNFDRMNNEPKRMAPGPFLARLPQRLLAHPSGGALAVLAHIERAWANSFEGADRSSQSQGFRDVLARLMRGDRIGSATDTFNLRWAALSVGLAEKHLALQRGEEIPLKTLGRLWIARDDARNFIILGDPAVKIATEKLPVL